MCEFSHMAKACEKARKWREGKHGTLARGSKVLKLSVSYLSELETGKKPFTTSVIKKYLKADPAFFAAADFY
jgi:transcriptional regulator with XRE-family HTH domain